MGLGDEAAENLGMQDPNLERSFRGHRGAVHSVCFNPSMKQLISGASGPAPRRPLAPARAPAGDPAAGPAARRASRLLNKRP